MTSRGFKENEFIKVADFIDRALKNKNDEATLKSIKEEVLILLKEHPLPWGNLWKLYHLMLMALGLF